MWKKYAKEGNKTGLKKKCKGKKKRVEKKDRKGPNFRILASVHARKNKQTSKQSCLIERGSVMSSYHGSKISGWQQQGVLERRRRTAKKGVKFRL